jgi:hypothetical protein
MTDKLKAEVDNAVLRASREMAIFEVLDSCSADYARGFLDGIQLESDFTEKWLQSYLTEVNEALDRALEARNNALLKSKSQDG